MKWITFVTINNISTHKVMLLTWNCWTWGPSVGEAIIKVQIFISFQV